jgi:hypothetical protein
LLASLGEADEPVENEAAGDGDGEAGAGADHGDLDAGTGGVDVFGGDALGLVAQQDDGPLGGGRQPRQRDGVVGESAARPREPNALRKTSPNWTSKLTIQVLGGDVYGIASIDGCDRSVALIYDAPTGGGTYAARVQCFIDLNSDRTITVQYKDVGREG